MPCRSDYMEPTERESYNRKTAKFLLWLVGKGFGKSTNTKKLVDDANSIYGGSDYTPEVCFVLKSLSKSERTDIFNEEDKIATELKLWWIEHLEGEERRAKEDAEEIKKKKLVISALSKLSKEEREALGY